MEEKIETGQRPYICPRCNALAVPVDTKKPKCASGHDLAQASGFWGALVGSFIASIVLFVLFFYLPWQLNSYLRWKLVDTLFWVFAAPLGLGSWLVGLWSIGKGLVYAVRSQPTRQLALGNLGLGIGLFVGAMLSVNYFFKL
ncbi:MAG: hypothetical protein ABI977_11755 [Acidobacteriota bacterium]